MNYDASEFPQTILSAPGTTRHRILVAEWANRGDKLIDEVAYRYSPAAAGFGTDPWTTIDSVDDLLDGNDYELWLTNGSSRIVRGDSPIYLSRKTYTEFRAAQDAS